MRGHWRKYVNVIPSAIAILNGLFALMLAEFFKDDLLIKIAIVGAAGILGGLAIWATIYSQHQIEKERAGEETRKRGIIEHLGEFIGQADGMMALCSQPLLPQAQADAWAGKVENYLRQNLGDASVIRFRNQTGISPLLLTGAPSNQHQNLWWGLYVRVCRLHEFSRVISV